MCAAILGFVGGLVLAASTQAAPLAHVPTPIELDAAPPVELVSGGGGWGWHRHYWTDRWGNLRRVAAFKSGGGDLHLHSLTQFLVRWQRLRYY
jgi:hypothetical protein